MGEVGCLKDGRFQNLQVEGHTQLSNTNFRRKVRIGAFVSNAMTVASTESGSIITHPVRTAASTITLPIITSDLAGWHVTIVAAVDGDAHATTIQQGANAQGTGAAAAPPCLLLNGGGGPSPGSC